MNVFMPSVGKKTHLVRLVRQALWPWENLIASDLDPHAPALKEARERAVLPTTTATNFKAAATELLLKKRVELIIPTRLEEFTFWKNLEKEFPKLKVACSDYRTVELGLNKARLYEWLKVENFPVASFLTWQKQSPEEVRKNLGDFPLFAKPSFGSGSKGVLKIENQTQLETLEEGSILQPFLRGQEFTVNLWI